MIRIKNSHPFAIALKNNSSDFSPPCPLPGPAYACYFCPRRNAFAHPLHGLQPPAAFFFLNGPVPLPLPRQTLVLRLLPVITRLIQRPEYQPVGRSPQDSYGCLPP
jgi:hypothetical protein